MIELASFQRFTDIQLAFLEQLVESLGIVVATIEATMRTDELLRQSQSMAEELQTQQEELQQTNEELEEKARQLTEQKTEVERKNREVELAKQELEEKAEQLALTSRYKSQFLANMSHELRTPLNSLLILSRQLRGQPRGQPERASRSSSRSTIHQSGADLLALINEILDLAKIESGTMAVDVGDGAVRRPAATTSSARSARSPRRRGSSFDDRARRRACRRRSSTDDMRLRQVLRNLLSNALKFTERGSVSLRIFAPTGPSWSVDNEVAQQRGTVIGFSVIDTGIGIPQDKQQIIFEAFQQADGGTSRKYGGTGLGLAISREIAGLLGGELQLESEPGVGSTFTLYPAGRATVRAAQPPATRRSPTPSAAAGAQHRRRRPAAGRGAAVRRRPAGAGARSMPTTATRIAARAIACCSIIEDDETFARTLLELARERGFRGVVAPTGAQALELARTPQARRHHARPAPARHGRLGGARSAQARPAHAPHPGARDLGARRASAAASSTAPSPSCRSRPSSRTLERRARAASQSFLERRVKQLLVVEDDDGPAQGDRRADRQRRRASPRAVDSGEEALAALERAALRLHGARPAAARHVAASS